MHTAEPLVPDYSSYRGISLLPTTYKILSNILVSRSTPYVEEIIMNHQCGFQHNGSNCSSDTGKKVGVSWDSPSVIYG